VVNLFDRSRLEKHSKGDAFRAPRVEASKIKPGSRVISKGPPSSFDRSIEKHSKGGAFRAPRIEASKIKPGSRVIAKGPHS
jgi:hypothetical protein